MASDKRLLTDDELAAIRQHIANHSYPMSPMAQQTMDALLDHMAAQAEALAAQAERERRLVDALLELRGNTYCKHCGGVLIDGELLHRTSCPFDNADLAALLAEGEAKG